MPYGTKETINFDAVYRKIIKPTATQIGLQCTRSDEVSEAGLIQKDMIDRIIKSDVVIVDITTVNRTSSTSWEFDTPPNVVALSLSRCCRSRSPSTSMECE